MRILLLGLCLLLAVIILIEWVFLPSQPQLVNQRGSGEINTGTTKADYDSVSAFTLPPLTEFDSVKERPIFIEGRRPLPPSQTVVQQEKPIPSRGGSRPPKMDLSAILIINNEPMALLRNPPKGVSTRLKTGDEFQGWQVEKIAPDRVTLKQSGKSEEFLLRTFNKVPLPRVSKAKKQRRVNKRVRRQPRRPSESAGDDES